MLQLLGRTAAVSWGKDVRVQPTLSLGAWAVHVPYPLVWTHEHVDDDHLLAHERYRRIHSLSELDGALDEMGRADASDRTNSHGDAPGTG